MPHLLGGIGLVLRDRYLLLIALLVVLLNWINSTGEFILADYVKADAVARVAASGGALDKGSLITAFYGNFKFWVTLIGFGIQLFLVSRIYRLVGVRGALLIHPIVVAVGYGLLALGPMLGGFVPIFTLIRLIKIARKQHRLFADEHHPPGAVPADRPDAKYEGKTAIETFFWRFGDLLQAGGVRRAQPPAMGRVQFALLNMVLALAWIGLAVAIGRSFSRKALENVMNVAPEAVEPIPDLLFSPGQPFLHPVSPATFRDADPGDVLNLRACCDDGKPLPRWMRFNERQRAFIGTVPVDVQIDELRIAVIASDVDGLKARSHVRRQTARNDLRQALAPGTPGGLRRAESCQGLFAAPLAAAGSASNASRRCSIALRPFASTSSPSDVVRLASFSAAARRRSSAPGAGGRALR